MKETLRSSPRRPVLQVSKPGRPGVARFAESFRIGRAPDNDIVLEEPSVSQRHAEVVFADGRWRLRDLDSTNGTVVGGQKIESLPITGPVRVRLGFSGPTLLIAPEGDPDTPPTLAPSESAVARRYLSRRPPTDMGELTAIVRGVLRRVQRRRARKYVIALCAVSVFGAGAGGYAYLLHQEVERQRAAARELFYGAKALELEIASLEPDERSAYRARQEELGRQYGELVEELGIYSEDTPEEVRLVYRVVHRFGESEVNVPREFVDEVLAYVQRWKTTTRLADAMARAHEHGYGERIAAIMLEHDMPPDFFYLALQESDLRLNAVGPETRFGIAKGMWQFLPGTARDYGLGTGPLVGVPRPDPRDERHEFASSTRAAARYLRHIYTTDAQASGLLVVAAYNWGQTRVLRLIRTLPRNPRERNFWRLLERYGDRIPRETYDYVFSIVSAAVIGEDPERFGFEFAPPFERPQPVAATASAP